jgi:hypothetical protein
MVYQSLPNTLISNIGTLYYVFYIMSSISPSPKAWQSSVSFKLLEVLPKTIYCSNVAFQFDFGLRGNFSTLSSYVLEACFFVVETSTFWKLLEGNLHDTLEGVVLGSAHQNLWTLLLKA